MSGINVIYKHSHVLDEDVKRISKMNDLFNGTQSFVWNDHRVVMSQVGQSVIGTQVNNDVLTNEKQSIFLVCSGEIYNSLELKDQLLHSGHLFRSTSSREVIIHLYEEYEDKCVDYLRGMFAFCLYDKEKERMIAVRDRMGEKTLYFAQVPCGIVFSTELKTILKEYIPNPQLNIQHLIEPIRYIAPLDRVNAWVEQIKRVQPGQMIIVDNSGMCAKQYWQYTHEPTFVGTREDALKLTLDKMQESVELSFRSDVPVAVMLSGGIDSSAVAALAKKAGKEVHSITVGFAGQVEYDERSIAKRFAEEQGFIYHELEMSPLDYDSVFEEFTQYFDEPITDSAAMAQWALYKKVKSLGFRVLLGGMGGDELNYGYAWINNQAKALKRQHEFESICPIMNKEDKKRWLKFVKNNWQAQFLPRPWHMINEDSFIPWFADDFKNFIKDATCKINDMVVPLSDFATYQTMPHCDYGKELDTLYDDAIKRIMVGAYLYTSNRLGDALDLEIRSPLIDYKVVEHFMSLPVEMKGLNKQLMKDSLSGILPQYILFGRKCGFTPSSNYPKEVAEKYKYRYVQSSQTSYASAIVDRLLCLFLKQC